MFKAVSVAVALALPLSFAIGGAKDKSKEQHRPYVLKVDGMECAKCVTKVTHALKSVQGVKDVEADLKTGKVSLVATSRLEVEKLEETVKASGFKATAAEPVLLNVRGMMCAACTAKVKRAVLGLAGVVSAHTVLDEGLCTVYIVPGKVKSEAIVEAITKSGFKATLKK